MTQIDAALLRLDTSEYGYCRACGVRIATTYLLEVPHTEHCLLCGNTGGDVDSVGRASRAGSARETKGGAW
ncbi:MAG TPA: hypothetical protein VNQ73_13490 [Ilumatobacter sp.]|nr:hypothetical protein [Ilumatobacter sp.]